MKGSAVYNGERWTVRDEDGNVLGTYYAIPAVKDAALAVRTFAKHTGTIVLRPYEPGFLPDDLIAYQWETVSS